MSKIEVNEIVPQSGTTLTLGGSGDTLSIASGVSSSFPSLTVSGDLTVDTNTLFVDSSNNRVGIGTASPDRPLKIISTSSSPIIEIQGSKGSGFEFGFGIDSNGGFLQQNGNTNLRAFVNGSERMRIDSSGNVLVGKTTVSVNNDGIQLEATGTLGVTRDGNDVLIMNRKTSDGDIAVFRKDGTTIASIGNSGNNLKITSTDQGLGNNSITVLCNTFRPDSDNVPNLGSSGKRFSDLYLGGNIYLGGTGSANALDDYEEGSFTPSLDIETGANITVNTIQGYYRKIGNLVAFTIFCDWDKTAGSNNMKFTGLPFTCSNQTNLTRQAVEWQQGAYTDQGAFFGGAVFGSSTDVYFVDSKYGSFNTNFDTNNAGRIANTTGIRSFVNGTYFTT